MGDNTENTTVSESESAVASMVSENTETTVTTGERPDNVPDKFWDDESKAVRHEDVLKSYNELQTRFGSFTGSPEDFKFNASQEMTEKLAEYGIELDVNEDPLYKAAVDMAKETNMNQEGFDKLANLFIMTQLGEVEAQKEHIATQMAELGERAETRVANIEVWGQKNLSPELYDSLQGNLQSAAMVPVLEHLISQTRNAPVSDSSLTTAPSISEADITAMQFAKDEHGNRKISTDRAFRAEYDRKMKEFYGDGENRIMVG